MSVLGPRGHVRFAFAVLIVAVGSLAAVLAQDRQSASTEVFRLNARHLEDGRVEVAVERFTGTEFERFTPASRYLPANHPVGEWLISEMFVIPVSTPGALVDRPAAGVVKTSTPLHRFNVASISPDTRMVIGDDGEWRYWIAPRDEGNHVYVTCSLDGGPVYAMEGVGSWSVVTAQQLMPMLTGTRWENAPQEIADGVGAECGMSVDAALVTEPATQRQRATPTGPPDWNLIESTAGMVTGNWSRAGPVLGMSAEEGGDWMVWQMHRANGADAYAACRQDSGSLYQKTHGGGWSSSGVLSLRAQFDFAAWHFIDHIMQDIGKSCGVHAPALGPSGQQTTDVPDPQPTTRTNDVSVVSGTAIMTTHQHELAIRYDSYSRSRWAVFARVKQNIGRHLLKAGTVSVTVGGRTFNFHIEQHSRGRDTSGALGGPGTEATLSGVPAHDFYCAAKGQTVSMSLPTTHDGTHTMSIYVRPISIRGATDLCE